MTEAKFTTEELQDALKEIIHEADKPVNRGMIRKQLKERYGDKYDGIKKSEINKVIYRLPGVTRLSNADGTDPRWVKS